mgnify:CR=1 FL=1
MKFRLLIVSLIVLISSYANATIIYDESINGDAWGSVNTPYDLTLSYSVNEILGSSYNGYDGSIVQDYDSYNLILAPNVLFAAIEIEISTDDVTSILVSGDWVLHQYFKFYDVNNLLLDSPTYFIDAVSQVTTGALTISDPAVRRIEFLRGGYSLNGTNCAPVCEATVNWGLTVKTSAADVPEPSTLAIFALGMIGLTSRRFKKQS